MPTNAMMSLLQAFPSGRPFQGEPRNINGQIANAFPTPLEFRLGLAVAEALESDSFDATDQVFHEATRWSDVP